MSHKALVFLSCGHRNGEREIAAEIEKLINSDEIGLSCFNADTRQGFDDVMSITEHLSKADYYLFIDFKRDGEIPISIFTHQEFALARALGITEMLAFREKGAPTCGTGIVGYVLAHPIEFERNNLVNLVRENIKKKGWRADYSRNLVVSGLRSTDGPVTYTDHHGSFLEKIWCVMVKNRRSDRGALNTIAIIDKVTDIAENKSWRPDTTFLKWASQQAYQKTIFPKDSAEIDAFAVRVNENGIFLHSANDIHPRKSIISTPGNYTLTYLLYADLFPPISFKINLEYGGPLLVSTEFRDSETRARLE